MINNSRKTSPVFAMDQNCVVFGCRNSSVIFQTKKNDCNFFNFPLNQPDLLAKWLKKLNLEKWNPGPENVICEEHFSLESFEIADNKRILKSEAVPSMTDDWRRIFATDDALFDTFDENDIEEDEELSNDLRCRICANFLSPSNAIDISSEDDNVMEKMMACIPILVKSADALPKHICRLCLTDLNISYRMLVRAIESEKLFNNLINKLPPKSPQNNEDVIEKTVDIEKTTATDCVICNVHFDNIDDLSNHFQEKHVDELDFVDQDVIEKPTERNEQTECDKFNDGMDMMRFVDEKIIENDFKNVSIIELEYEDGSMDVESNQDQVTTSFVKIKYTCSVCTMSFTSKNLLDFHTENFHKPEERSAQSTSRENANLEEEAEDGADQNAGDEAQYLVCQFCMQVFCTVDELNEHLETHMESLACDVCGCLCQDSEKLKKHRETHVKRTSKNNTCPICFTVFLSHTEMAQHSKDVHRVKDNKDETVHQKWICKYCGKEIGTKLSLSIHERIHTGVRPYVCECCGRSFKSKANLIQHQPVHTGVKRYKCSVCDKAFARKAFVTTHMRVHTGERPFRCEICGNRYTQIGDMRRHKKRHMINQTANSVVSLKPIVAVPSLPTRAIQVEDPLADDDKSEPAVDDSTTAVVENNGLIKLHFAKDVTDFRRILVELQQ